MRKLLLILFAAIAASACGPSQFQRQTQLDRISCSNGMAVSCIDYQADLQRQNLAMAAIMSNLSKPTFQYTPAASPTYQPFQQHFATIPPMQHESYGLATY
jgi:hypothetical protein